MRMSRALARRIDRLAVRAHAFHRYAHHPLCERYRGELIALRGRTRVCRGCAYALLGAVSGAVVGLAVSSTPGLPLVAAGACALAWTLATLRPQTRAPTRDDARTFASPPAAAETAQRSARADALAITSPPAAAEPQPPARASKLWTRALPAFAWTCSLVALARAAHPLVLLPLAAAISGWQRYRRRGPDRALCRDCPERHAQPCAGYLPIVRAERAFVRLSQRLIDAESSSS